jgi:hypothetical protein
MSDVLSQAARKLVEEHSERIVARMVRDLLHQAREDIVGTVCERLEQMPPEVRYFGGSVQIPRIDSANVDYLPSGSAPTYGWASRSAAGRFDDRVSVKNFKNSSGSAVQGDGVTDDSTGIQSALTWCATNNKTLWFPDATYGVGSSGWTGFLVSSLSNFAIVGGLGVKIKQLVQPSQSATPTSSKALFKFSACTDFSVSGIQFDGNSIASACVNVDQCQRYAIYANEFKNFTTTSGYGVFATRGNSGLISGNYYENCGYANYAGHTSAGYAEDRLTVCANRCVNIDQDFVVGVLTNSVIDSNIADGLVNKALVALSASAADGTFSQNVTITGNYCSGTAGSCIQSDVTGSIQIKNITISGNTLKSAGNYGIYMPNVLGFSFTGNSIRDCNGGIFADAVARKGTISGNTVDASGITPTQHGIALHTENTTNGVQDVSVTGNFVNNYSGADGITITVVSTGTASRVAITGNVVTGCDRGIDVAGTGHTAITVDGNTCKNNTTYDINISSSDVAIGTNYYGTFNGFTGAPNTQTGATYSVVLTDKTVIANRAGTVTLTLPAVASSVARKLRCVTIQNQTVVSNASNVVPLAGGAAGTAILAGTAGKWADLECDGSNWIITASN